VAPDLLGLHPDEAERCCRESGLELVIENPEWLGTYWGEGQPWHVAEQVPGAGQPMVSATIVVHVSLRNRPGGAGVREPRRPLPPDRPLRVDDPRD
jgi:hypothetical protein